LPEPRDVTTSSHVTYARVRYALLWIALAILLGIRSHGDAWIGDFWIYVATIGESAARPVHPGNPLFAAGYPFAFFTPYTVGLGLVSRITGLAPLDVLTWQGLVNLALLGAALYGFVATWVKRPMASFYALLFLLFLWGHDPWLFSGVFHLRSLAYVLPYPSTCAAALALGTLALFPRIVGSMRAWLPIVFPVAVGIWIVHPVTGLFLWIGLGAYSLAAPSSRWHWIALALAAAASFGLAMAWPLVPMRDLWFGQLARIHEGNDSMYSETLTRIAPALLGVPWMVVRLARDRRDPLALFTLALVVPVVYGGVSGAWSYGRLIPYAVLMLQVALGDAVAAGEERLSGRARGAWLRHLVGPALAVVLIAFSWPAVASVLAQCTPGVRRWLAFLETRVGREDVVLTDLDSCWYVPAFRGKVVAYPMQLPFVPDHDARKAAVLRFFAPGVSKSERTQVLERYGVRYVLLAKEHFEDASALQAELQELGTSAYSSDDYELLRVSSTLP
jgi:hypothetical protein